MKFKIAVEDTWRRVYEVEAKDEQEAIARVQDDEAEIINEGDLIDTKTKVLSAEPTVIQAKLIGGE